MNMHTSSVSTPEAGSFAEFAADYRERARELLAAALELAKEFPCVSLLNEQRHRELSSTWKEDRKAVFEATTGLLVRKACLHVTAALRANDTSNMHSLAAQMRPALECAGQVVTTMKDLFEGGVRGKSAVISRTNADYYKTITRLTQGELDPQDLLPDIVKMHLADYETGLAKGRFYLQDTVKDLENGEEWYDHLSDCFFHSDLTALKGFGFCGGVSSSNSVDDQISFGSLLDYLTDQVLIMIHYAAMCPPETKAKEQHYKRAVALIKEKHKGLASYRDTLALMVQQGNGAGAET